MIVINFKVLGTKKGSGAHLPDRFLCSTGHATVGSGRGLSGKEVLCIMDEAVRTLDL